MKKSLLFSFALPAVLLAAAGCCGSRPDSREPEITEVSLSAMPTEVEEEKALKFITCGFYVTAKNTPAEWARRFAKPVGGRLFYLGLSENGRADEIRDLAHRYDEVQLGLNWKRTPEAFTIPRLAAAPELNGVVNEAKYGKAVQFKGEYPLNTENHLHADGITWYLGWHGDKLYAAAKVKDRNVYALDGHGSAPSWNRLYKGDCIELFIRPTAKTEHYYEFLVNPDNGNWFLDHVVQDSGFWRTINRERPTRTRTAARRTADGYEVEFEVPLREFVEKYLPDEKPQPGDVITLMMIHIDAQKFSDPEAARCTLFPHLYEGHNIFGFAVATLGK